jgi:hypothetical protein
MFWQSIFLCRGTCKTSGVGEMMTPCFAYFFPTISLFLYIMIMHFVSPFPFLSLLSGYFHQIDMGYE